MKLTAVRLKWLPTWTQHRIAVSRQRRARQTIIWFVMLFVGINIGLSLCMEYVTPGLRDRAYISRLERIRSRAKAMPQTVVLGSSRIDHAIRPDVLDAPIATNSAQVGAGPLLQLLTLKRLLADGVQPAGLVVEFWPPFLRSDGNYSEWIRIDPHRYFLSDEQFLRDYHDNPDAMMAFLWEVRRTPVWNHRQWLLSQTLPSWLPKGRRLDGGWDRLQPDGWRPGWERVSPEQRAQSLVNAKEYFAPLLAEWSIDAREERALREIASICKSRNIPLTIVWLPESPTFRSWYPERVVQESERFLKSLADEATIVNARDWLGEESFVDGYHLMAPAATEFTRRIFEQNRR